MQPNLGVLISYANTGLNNYRFKRIQWEVLTNLYTASWKLPIILVTFYWKFNFLKRFSKKCKTIL